MFLLTWGLTRHTMPSHPASPKWLMLKVPRALLTTPPRQQVRVQTGAGIKADSERQEGRLSGTFCWKGSKRSRGSTRHRARGQQGSYRGSSFSAPFPSRIRTALRKKAGSTRSFQRWGVRAPRQVCRCPAPFSSCSRDQQQSPSLTALPGGIPLQRSRGLPLMVPALGASSSQSSQEMRGYTGTAKRCR